MDWKKGVFLAGAVFVGTTLFLKWQNPVAGKCVYKEEDKNWSFLTFYNKCDYPINVMFCEKLSVGELAKLFGYNTGEWSCNRYRAARNQTITTIKWVNDNSSVASHLLSTSRYLMAACRSPYSPKFMEGSDYKCVE